MSKTLIHFPKDRIAPKGGPSGYLYNLSCGLNEIGAEEFDFLPPAGSSYEQNRVLQRLVPGRLKDIRRLRNLLMLPDRSLPAPVDYASYDCLHFHSTEDLYLHRNTLEQYRGTVILTSHSPCVYHEELISRLNPKDADRKKKELASLEQIDTFAFRRADVVVFPCPEAEEPYYHTWENYALIRNESKLRYLPTGIQGCTAKVDRDEVRKNYGIPSGAFVMSYVGRHNSVKGYDSLKDAVLPMLDQDSNMWMIVAGKEGPLSSPSHERWIEAGWTNDPHSLIAASDVFILPNKETFFDLIMLEVLSLGVPIVASDTGGNRYFNKFENTGIKLYSDSDELVMSVSMVKEMSSSERQILCESNKALFASEFGCARFAKRYRALIGGLCS